MDAISQANKALTFLDLSTQRSGADSTTLRGTELSSIYRLLQENRTIEDFRIGDVAPVQRKALLKAALANPALKMITFGRDSFQLKTPLSNTDIAPPESALDHEGLTFGLQELESDPVLKASRPIQQREQRLPASGGPIWSQFKDWQEDPFRT